MPVHRLHIEKSGSVYAYRSELDVWWSERQSMLEAGQEPVKKHNLWIGVFGVTAATAFTLLMVAMDLGGIRTWLKGIGTPQIHSLAVLPLQNLSSDPVGACQRVLDRYSRSLVSFLFWCPFQFFLRKFRSRKLQERRSPARWTHSIPVFASCSS